MGSQHILLHLYEFIQRDYRNPLYVTFSEPPVAPRRVAFEVGPILALMTLSDTQDMACLNFRGGDPGCMGRILEIVKAVKRQPVELLCLLADIINILTRKYHVLEAGLFLEVVKQAIVPMDEESVTSLLRLMASGVKSIQQLAVGPEPYLSHTGVVTVERIAREAQQICIIIEAKYAARLISSTAQLQLLSCARSAAVPQPAMGWLRMHEPL
jgi:hypothetical protein